MLAMCNYALQFLWHVASCAVLQLIGY